MRKRQRGLTVASAGDGGARSDQRRTDDSISLRCSAQKKARYKRKAERLGYPGLSAWIVDLMDSDGGVSLRVRRVLCGRLGQIGARLSALAQKDLPDAVIIEMVSIVADIVRLQTDMINGARDVAETD